MSGMYGSGSRIRPRPSVGFDIVDAELFYRLAFPIAGSNEVVPIIQAVQRISTCAVFMTGDRSDRIMLRYGNVVARNAFHAN